MVPGSTIELQHLPQQLLALSVTAHEAILLPPGGVRFDNEISELEVALLDAALHRSAGSKTAAARLLHLDSQRMKYLCRKYSL
jgi:transcriptional regulator with GAF, ATPase, and Fis domain